MLYVIVSFLGTFESVIGFALISASIMRFREPAKKRIIIGFLLMLIARSILLYMGFKLGSEAVLGLAVIVIFLVNLAWVLICSKDEFFISIFNLLTSINIYIFISYIANSLTMDSTELAYKAEFLIFRTLIDIIIIPLMFIFIRPRFRMLVDNLDKEWRAATLVPLIFLILQISLLYYHLPYWDWESGNWYKVITIIVYILFMAVYYLLYVQAKSIVEKYSMEKKNLIMAQQEKLWESELARQKASTALAFQQRHDMHHHNAVIIALLKSGARKELESYMESFNTSLDSHNDYFLCSNPIANSIFNFYASRANQKGINTNFHVSVPEDIGIDNIDLTCVLGNTLENALEGCLRLPQDEEKEISVTAKFIDKRLRVQVENTCLADIVFEGDLPLTQKKDGGTGTKSILYTAERYDGTAGFSYADGKFITQIVLNAD